MPAEIRCFNFQVLTIEKLLLSNTSHAAVPQTVKQIEIG